MSKDNPPSPESLGLRSMPPRAARRVLLDEDLQVDEDEVVRNEVVEKAKVDVATNSLHEEVDMEHVLNSLLPDL